MSNRIVLLAAALVLVGCADTETETATVEQDTLTAPAAPAEAAPATGALLDPETATRDELVAIPGMTPEAADALIAGRPYENMLAVNEALSAHLEEAQRDQVYAYLFKPLDLNSASGEEIQLIPGVGDRMQHEFEEYRPYTSIEEFRREIGKYVDEAEVARYEKYIMIRQ